MQSLVPVSSHSPRLYSAKLYIKKKGSLVTGLQASSTGAGFTYEQVLRALGFKIMDYAHALGVLTILLIILPVISVGGRIFTQVFVIRALSASDFVIIAGLVSYSFPSRLMDVEIFEL